MARYLPFVQLELTRALGPEAGRYVVEPVEGDAAAADADVLLIDVVGAPAARRRVPRRGRALPAAEAPAEVPVARATLVRNGDARDDPEAARAKLDELRGDEPERERWIQGALAALNRAIGAYRIAAHDPYAIEVSRFDPRVVRIGYGTAEEVARGDWQDAFAAPRPRGRRSDRAERLGIAEIVAAVLAGRERPLAGEEALVRAVLDIAEGRLANAAAELSASIELLDAELAGEDERALERWNAIAAKRSGLEGRVRHLAQGAPNPDDAAELETIASELERFLAGRRARSMHIQQHPKGG